LLFDFVGKGTAFIWIVQVFLQLFFILIDFLTLI